VRHEADDTVTVVPGAGTGPSQVAFLRLPSGFCAHYFTNLGNARQLRFAPNGDLFVASPTRGTTSGGLNGRAAIVVLPDDDRDGLADAPLVFLPSLPSTQGILFADGYFYYQDDTRVMRVPYTSGDRAAGAPSEKIADTAGVYFTSALHWPKSLDMADDGTIYLANGSDQEELCDGSRPFRGGILRLDGSPAGTPVAKGFRNPIAVRCERGKNLCFASELAKDYSGDDVGREKIVPIRSGDDWGFPCCATRGKPYIDVSPVPDCSGITPEDVSFYIGDTPFGLDFERGKWQDPYRGSMFVVLHGAAGSWTGARIVYVSVDPATGLPEPGSTITRVSTGAMTDFAKGWEDGGGGRAHGRPTAIEFASDGRMFVSNDANGDIFWIAPLDLVR
jgi:glucose/arabinose dehydrogenase